MTSVEEHALPDTTAVELHRAPDHPWVVRAVEGRAWLMHDVEHPGVPLEVGTVLRSGSIVALDANAVVRLANPKKELQGDTSLEQMDLNGGGRGRAHSFVAPDAFRGSPNNDDVPRLIEELDELEHKLIEQVGSDPLPAAIGPGSKLELAASRDFAFSNLVLDDARVLPEPIARANNAVVLFANGESVCVAVHGVGIKKLSTLMRTLGRPVHPHPVDTSTIDALFLRIYG
ncbi:MAG: hypothetical protein HYV07_01840 [Deltaproteobacteria bacterium]|nr:hypothetical protein [Deltaproteobacteria bacterium]